MKTKITSIAFAIGIAVAASSVIAQNAPPTPMANPPDINVPARLQGQIDASNIMIAKISKAVKTIDLNGNLVFDPAKGRMVSLIDAWIKFQLTQRDMLKALEEEYNENKNYPLPPCLGADFYYLEYWKKVQELKMRGSLIDDLIVKSGMVDPKTWYRTPPDQKMMILIKKLEELGLANTKDIYIGKDVHNVATVYLPGALAKLVLVDGRDYSARTFPFGYSDPAIYQDLKLPVQQMQANLALADVERLLFYLEMPPFMEAWSHGLNQYWYGSSNGSNGYGYAFLSLCMDLPALFGDIPPGKLKKLYTLIYLTKVGWDVNDTYKNISKNWDDLTTKQMQDMIGVMALNILCQQMLNSKMQLPDAEIAKIRGHLINLAKIQEDMEKQMANMGTINLTRAQNQDLLEAKIDLKLASIVGY